MRDGHATRMAAIPDPHAQVILLFVHLQPCVIRFLYSYSYFMGFSKLGEKGLHSRGVSCGKDHVIHYVLLFGEVLRLQRLYYEQIWILCDKGELLYIADWKETLKAHFRIEITKPFLGQ